MADVIERDMQDDSERCQVSGVVDVESQYRRRTPPPPTKLSSALAMVLPLVFACERRKRRQLHKRRERPSKPWPR